ncbi:MAG TPA: hypothetical protein ENK66_02385 [Arcobacter sp.]|nr:hypothetical protein [Arcobacter sp.]
MLKIKYPKNRENFESDYINSLNISTEAQDKFKAFLNEPIFKECNITSLDELLVFPFEKLLEIYNLYMKKYPFPKGKNKREKDEKLKIEIKYEDFFAYQITYQRKIANFFMKYSEVLQLKTCYFCNIEYINTFDNRGEYSDFIDFINNATMEELIQIYNIVEKDAKSIIQKREKKPIVSIDELNLTSKKKENLKNLKFKINQESHFTLDHFLPKANCPILALSLYNFVPSCYSCNSKFKQSEVLLKSHLSPTSKDFSVNYEVKFKLFFAENRRDFNLIMKHPKNKGYEDYIKIFKLKGRYTFHKGEVRELLIKKRKYPQSRIDEMAKAIKIPRGQIRKDIFGKELFENDSGGSMSKLKRDIAKDMGIL